MFPANGPTYTSQDACQCVYCRVAPSVNCEVKRTTWMIAVTPEVFQPAGVCPLISIGSPSCVLAVPVEGNDADNGCMPVACGATDEVGAGVAVDVLVGVGDGVGVTVGVAVGVTVGVGDGVGVAVGITVGVGVLVGVDDVPGVTVGVGDGFGVGSGVGDGFGVGVGVGCWTGVIMGLGKARRW